MVMSSTSTNQMFCIMSSGIQKEDFTTWTLNRTRVPRQKSSPSTLLKKGSYPTTLLW